MRQGRLRSSVPFVVCVCEFVFYSAQRYNVAILQLSIPFPTRYAIEWHLSPLGPWLANVYISRQQPRVYRGAKIVAFCINVLTPLDLENVIRRTQIVVFDPMISFQDALNTDEASLRHFETQLASRQSYCAMSTIHVYLQCPGFIPSPMVFVDLPSTWNGALSSQYGT